MEYGTVDGAPGAAAPFAPRFWGRHNGAAMAIAPPSPRKVVHRVCPACGRDNRNAPASRYTHPEWPLKHCLGCGFTYIETAPVYEELTSDYAWEKNYAETHTERTRKHPLMMALSQRTRWRTHLLGRRQVVEDAVRLGRGRPVLDVGCGKGDYLVRLPDGVGAYGIEISRAEAGAARRQLEPRGGVVICAPAVEGLQEMPPDLIGCAILRAYLEHEARPAEVLRELHRVLVPGGAAIVKVPNYGSLNRMVMGRRWCGFRFPDHLNYFDPRSLLRMFRANHFHRFRFRFLDRLPVNDNMWLVAFKDG